jgi:HlyD family secretion protein
MKSITPHRKWIWAATLILVLVAVGCFVIYFSQREQVANIAVVQPAFRDVSSTVVTNGKVMPIEDFQVRAAFSGMVEKIFVKVGQAVHPGQMLIKLKDPFAMPRYTNAVASLQSAVVGDQNIRQNGSREDRINLTGDLKRASFERTDAANRLQLLQSLKEEGNASVAEVADAEHRLTTAQTTLDTLTERSTDRYTPQELSSSAARLADARANLNSARTVLANANITSQIAGTAYSIPVSTYDFVNMGNDLLHIANLNAVQIRAEFDEPDIGQLSRNQPVEVSWDAKPGALWHGHLEQPPLSVVTQGVRNVGICMIPVDDAEGNLLPNTNVTVKVTTMKHSHVLSIPREALHTDGPRHFVYRIIGEKAIETPVETGIINLSFVEIVSGVSASDVIALRSMSDTALRNGMRVKTVN